MSSAGSEPTLRLTPWAATGLLLVTAAVWGLAFVAQRAGMAYIGPFTYNAARFALGAAVLEAIRRWRGGRASPATLGRAGWGLGVLVFAGASLQQAGLVFTTAGKAGFITGLYVVLVPLIATLRGQRQTRAVWLGAGLAAGGMYLLSATRDWRLELGDGLVLLSAVFWALHVLAVDHWGARHDPLTLAARQFWVVAGLSALVALAAEPLSGADLVRAGPAILYGGLVSVGVGYTLQVVAQPHAAPGPAAIVLSLEAVFALIGGTVLLHERLSRRGLAGAGLMLLGMLVAQQAEAPKPIADRGAG